jgi:hypothetical protein
LSGRKLRCGSAALGRGDEQAGRYGADGNAQDERVKFAAEMLAVNFEAPEWRGTFYSE